MERDEEQRVEIAERTTRLEARAGELTSPGFELLTIDSITEQTEHMGNELAPILRNQKGPPGALLHRHRRPPDS
jgi:hypothetical protein